MAETIQISPFPLGMNNVQKESKLPDGSLRSAINVDVTDDGSVRRRPKFSKVYAGVNISSLYKRLFVENGELKYLNEDNTAIVVNTDIGSSDVSYTMLNGGIYYTDGVKVFGPTHEPLGLEKPTNFNISNATGSLVSGKYQVSICYINLATGELSGSMNPVLIEVSSGGIQVSNISIPKGNYATNIYLSDTNGSDLYFHSTLVKGVTQLLVSSAKQNKHVIQTLNMSVLSGGDIIRAYNGRLYVANGNVLYYSQAQRYGLSKPGSDFYLFAEPITTLEIVDNGIYVVADKTYFIGGADPQDATLREVSNLTSIAGTGITLDASYFNLEYNGKVAFWFSNQGGVIGLPSGVIKEFSKDRLAVPNDLTKGSTTYIEDNGIHKLITAMDLDGSGIKNNVGAGDNATATIIRNGVII